MKELISILVTGASFPGGRMNLKCLFGHKWETVVEPSIENFFGMRVIHPETKMQVCKICNKKRIADIPENWRVR